MDLLVCLLIFLLKYEMYWLQRGVLSLLNLKLNVLFHCHLQLPDFLNFAESVQVNLQFILEISELGSSSVTPGPYFVVFSSFHCWRGGEGSSSSMISQPFTSLISWSVFMHT